MMEEPDVCYACKTRHAIGVGIGYASRHDTTPKWICAECALIIEDIRRVRNFDAYELKALDAVDEAAGEYVAGLGQSDLAELGELERKMLWKAVVGSFGDELRRLIRGGAAPW